MKKNQLIKIEKKVIEIIGVILEQYKKLNIPHNLDVFSELILISRILQQRMKKNYKFTVKEFEYVTLAKKKILKEIQDDNYFDFIEKFLKNYQSSFNKKLN